MRSTYNLLILVFVLIMNNMIKVSKDNFLWVLIFDISADWSENTKILYPLTLSAFRASEFGDPV